MEYVWVPIDSLTIAIKSGICYAIGIECIEYAIHILVKQYPLIIRQRRTAYDSWSRFTHT